MNVPAPKFLIEKTWEGRVFGAEWRSAAGGLLDVLEPATGRHAHQRRQCRPPPTCAGRPPKRAPRSPAGQRRLTRSAPRSCARPPACSEDNQEELIPWIARETGGIPAKAGFEIHMVTEILYRSAAMCTEPQGLVLPSDPGRISLARRLPRGVIGVISPFNFPLILSSRAVGARRSRPATRWCSSPIRAPP